MAGGHDVRRGVHLIEWAIWAFIGTTTVVIVLVIVSDVRTRPPRGVDDGEEWDKRIRWQTEGGNAMREAWRQFGRAAREIPTGSDVPPAGHRELWPHAQSVERAGTLVHHWQGHQVNDRAERMRRYAHEVALGERPFDPTEHRRMRQDFERALRDARRR